MRDLFLGENTYTFPPPRACQVVAIEKLRDGFRAGHRNQLLVLPTGGGKSLTALMLIAESLKKGKRAVFVCDRITLINQTSKNADAYGMQNHAIVQAEHWRRDNEMPFQIASIQTIKARNYWPQADLIVIDEAHYLMKPHKELLLEKRVPVIGLTATPCTAGLGKYFTNVVNAATMHELTEVGVLVPLNPMTSIAVADMAGADMDSKGEWTKRDASEREAKIVGDVVGEWIKHGEDRKTIAFGADIAYCNLLVQRFNQAGIAAASYTSADSDAECELLLAEFSKTDSSIKILVSVEKLAKGFDCPSVSCINDARPLRKSLSTYIQMIGRGLRCAPGKKDCLLLDFTGNFDRFLAEFEDVYRNGFRSLNEAEKLDSKVREDGQKEMSGCPKCGRVPFRRLCLSCGYEKQTQVLEDTAAASGMRPVSFAGQIAAANDFDLWRQLCGYARTRSAPDKQPGRASNLYRNMTGNWPPREFVFAMTESAPLSAATANKIRSLDIAYRKSLKRPRP